MTASKPSIRCPFLERDHVTHPPCTPVAIDDRGRTAYQCTVCGNLVRSPQAERDRRDEMSWFWGTLVILLAIALF